MNTLMTRRHLLAAGAAMAAMGPAQGFAQIAAALERGFVNAADFGLISNNAGEGDDPAAYDQANKMRTAVNAAAGAGLPLFVPAGIYAMNLVDLPSSITLFGVRGATTFISIIDAPIFTCFSKSGVTLRDLTFDGAGSGANADNPGLLVFGGCEGVELDGVHLTGGIGNGIHASRTSGRLENLVVHGFGDCGIFAIDGAGMRINGNRIFNCANGGVRVWSSADGGHDGTIVTGNDIYGIRADSGGNGQNGNGINVYRANGVTITGNHLKDCAFSAIRVNSGNDTIVSGNTCLQSGEVAIFSEFAFSGSIIADNVVDGAAQGISITNFDSGGRLASCTGNIVRNIAASSQVNPDTRPAGIFAEADTVIANNIVESVPGVGIGAGWGPYLRDVVVSDNLIRDADIGIGVSVAEGAGAAVVSGNRVAGARRAAIAGMAWQEIASDDLARDAATYPAVTLSGNSVG